jgi:hypothetical protein
MNTQSSAVPAWFWIVAVLAILWNAVGVMAYLGDVTQSSEDLAAMSQTMRDLYASRPTWAAGGFAAAVFGGLLGGILLVLRKKLATSVFVVSILGLLVHNYYWFGMSKVHQLFPDNSQAMPITVMAVAILLAWFARFSSGKGWLR